MIHRFFQSFLQNSPRLGLFLALTWALGACDAETIKKEIGKPQARGRVGEVIVVIDSAKWSGPVGAAVRQALAPTVPGLLADEPAMTLRHVLPQKFNDLLRRSRNIVVVAPLEGNSASTQRLKQFFTPESLARIAIDDSTYMLPMPDEFAMGQMVLFLFGKDDQTLVRNLENHAVKVGAVFNDLEIKRMTQSYLKVRAENGRLDKQIANTHQVAVPVPSGYKFVMEKTFGNGEAGFVWLRHPDYEVDRNIFVAYKPYNSEKQFDQDSVLAWRNQLCQSYIFGDPAKPRSYVITEKLVPPAFAVSKVGGRYAVEMRGLWRTYDQVVMGGPFLGYAFADPKKGRLYYAEGFLYAPARDRKRELMREFEVVLKNIQ
jgi:hypothetical protein